MSPRGVIGLKKIFPAVKQGLMMEYEDENCTYLNQLGVKNMAGSLFHKEVKNSLIYHPVEDLPT
jgi:hypothetical protein